MGKTLTIVLTKGPYAHEAPYTVLRIAEKALEKGYNVNLVTYLDGTYVTHHKQKTKAYPVVSELFHRLIKKGAIGPKFDCIACVRCTEARGITDEMIEGVIIGALYDVMDLAKLSEKVIVIPPR